MSNDTKLGTNVAVTFEGDVLVLRIDTSQRHGVSASQKSKTCGSTGGNVEVPGHPELRIGVNCYEPVRRRVG